MAELRVQPARYLEVSFHPAAGLQEPACCHLRPAKGGVVPFTSHGDAKGHRQVSSCRMPYTTSQVSRRPQVCALPASACDPHQLCIKIWHLRLRRQSRTGRTAAPQASGWVTGIPGSVGRHPSPRPPEPDPGVDERCLQRISIGGQNTGFAKGWTNHGGSSLSGSYFKAGYRL